jgi:RNA polymerase sigma-70 factor (ECF subfamily)
MSETDRTEEEFSLEALQNGDQAEYAKVVDAYSGYVYRLALKMVNNPQDAEDILQETFIKAYDAFPDFEGRSKISTWLYRIATNEALMFLRSKDPTPVSVEQPYPQEQESTPKPLEIVDWCCLPEDEMLTDEVRQYLSESVEELSDALKATFVLRDIEKLSTKEAAEVLGISESAVKTRLHRARMQLRESLSDYFKAKV